MEALDREIYFVQNPSLGATVLWRFVCGYYSTDKKPAPFPLLFLVLPIIFRQDLCEVIQSTRKKSGLVKISEKLFKDKKNDRLYFIHHSAEKYKSISLFSLNIGISANLLLLDTKTALIYPAIETSKTNVSTPIKNILAASEKLGIWCSELTLYEISTLLKVRF